MHRCVGQNLKGDHMKTIEDYPDWMLEAVRAIHEGAPIVQVQGGDLNSTTHTVQTFNKFKLLLIQSMRGSDLAKTAKVITIPKPENIAPPGLKGNYIISIVKSESVILSNTLRTAKRGGPTTVKEIKAAAVDADIERSLEKQDRPKEQYLDEGDKAIKDLMNLDLDKYKDMGDKEEK